MKILILITTIMIVLSSSTLLADSKTEQSGPFKYHDLDDKHKYEMTESGDLHVIGGKKLRVKIDRTSKTWTASGAGLVAIGKVDCEDAECSRVLLRGSGITTQPKGSPCYHEVVIEGDPQAKRPGKTNIIVHITESQDGCTVHHAENNEAHPGRAHGEH